MTRLLFWLVNYWPLGLVGLFLLGLLVGGIGR